MIKKCLNYLVGYCMEVFTLSSTGYFFTIFLPFDFLNLLRQNSAVKGILFARACFFPVAVENARA